MTEVIIYVETPGCSCCGGEDKGNLFALKDFVDKVKEILGKETTIKINPDSSEEFQKLKRGVKKRIRPPIVILNGKIISNGKYPSAEKLKKSPESF